MKKRKSAKIAVMIVLVCIAAVLVGAFFLYRSRAQHISLIIDGETTDVKGLDDAIEKEALKFNSAAVTITEDGREELKGTLADFGYTADTEKMKSDALDTVKKNTETFSQRLKAINSGVHITIRTESSFDESTFAGFVKSASFSTPRTASTQGSVAYDETSKTYVMQEGVQGNEIDDTVLQTAVKTSIDKAVSAESTDSGVTIEVPENAYTSEKVSTEDNDRLKAQADALNKYAASKINYQFGSETVTLDISTFKDWLTYSDADQTVSINHDAVTQYVISLKAKYDTRYKTRGFTTTGGAVVTFSAGENDYGYIISQDKEAAQLAADIASGTEVTREPIYASKNSYGNPVYYKRNGVDDLAGNYVEVDITKQHLWFYKDGSLVVESDVVTGDVSKDRGTKTGVFPLAYKESPSVLSSQVNGYEEQVNYWMPFYDGQGLHDAPWRSAFGGSIYKGSGSHGCVNLPENVAATIYNNITSGTAIILYTEP